MTQLPLAAIVLIRRAHAALLRCEAQAVRDGSAYLQRDLANLHEQLAALLSVAGLMYDLPSDIQPLSGGGEKQRPPTDGDQQP